MHITKIISYPIKSLNGITRSVGEVLVTGLKDDRMMLLMDENDRLLSQRKYPQMALLKLRAENDSLRVSAEDMPDLIITDDFSDHSIPLEVWGNECKGFTAADDINDWFSTALGQPARLMRYDQASPRQVDLAFSKLGDEVGFADDSPILAISQASLNDLNARLLDPVSYRNFRPNFVFEAEMPFEEDNWKQVTIGDVDFDVAKSCGRCILTTVDPDTGIWREDREPVKTLGDYRRSGKSILFGINLIPRSTGSIEVGECLVVNNDNDMKQW